MISRNSHYIVVGSTGEYSDQQEWTVAAFWSRRRALTWARNANRWLRARGLHSDQPSSPIGRHKCPYDDNCVTDYTGTDYRVERVAYNPPLPTAAEDRA